MNMFFSRTKFLLCFSIFSIIVIILLFYINTPLSNIIASALSAILVSIIVSVLYNADLHKAMDMYQRIGLINYYDNFEDAHSVIKDKISKAKDVDIFVMYGDSFLSTSTKAIQSLLCKDNSALRYAMYSSTNVFLEAYGHYWGVLGENSRYNKQGLLVKIEGVKNDLKRLIKNKHNNCIFELYEIQNSPISYSFYIVDDELFFVPGKNISAKEIKPAVFHFKKTNSEFAMFDKVKSEFELMIKNNEILLVDLNESQEPIDQ